MSTPPENCLPSGSVWRYTEDLGYFQAFKAGKITEEVEANTGDL